MWPQSRISFKNHDRQLALPFIIYVHFDSLQIPQNRTRTKILHKPCGFAYTVKCTYDDSLSKHEDYIGEDSPRVLWKKLEEEAIKILEKIQTKSEPRKLNEEEKHLHEKITKCYLCRKELGDDRFEDFHPLTGDFLGVGHKKCVVIPKIPSSIPIVMQNFGKYGSHFLKSELNDQEKKSVFPMDQNWGFMRKYPSFVLRFLDLRQFIDEKIEDLESILSDSKKHRLKREFKKKTLFELMKKKNHFPYYHMDNFEKFKETSLPSEIGFFDQLHDEKISQEAYQRSVDVWKQFKCKTIDDYFRIYAKSNVFLLEDIFENFRSLCMDNYHLDPTHYFTIASFAWDSMLKYTGVELELLKDGTMIDFIKSNIRGGINQCNKRHAKANNNYCTYDELKHESFIIYLDANNLGGWAMSQKLPFSDFTWMSRSGIETIGKKIPSLDDDGDFGYIFEVDLDYPKTLHKLHNDLPFCLQKMSVSAPSNFPNYNTEKAILNFYNKTKYVIDYRTLKQCLENGLILKKIHRVLKFQQSKWLEPYISYNTTLRANAKNDFESKLYKLLNNSVYGKTIQKTSKDKPIYAGFSILELSKKFMYDFHYKTILPRYKNKINLLYIDTDGVIYEIETSDFFQDLKSDRDLLKVMDTSNLDPRWDIPSKNKKAVGKMKDEYGGKIIREFFSVGAKMYFLDVEGEEIKKAAGVKKYVKAKHISREDYANCVLQDKPIARSFFETCAEDHQVKSQKKRKTVLSPGDKKRVVLADKINTRALGYEEN